MNSDICVFNYRGYGSSSGVPTPARLKADTECVIKYLREVKKIKKLLLHGESIGGMMACHGAKVCGTDLLICDRTFCSLDAVAERLLGTWASFGLNYICQWKTDVVSDFLGANCAKLVIQDPTDEIISHCSSLKCGVAAAVTLHDFKWAKVDFPLHYVLAELKNEPMVLFLFLLFNIIHY